MTKSLFRPAENLTGKDLNAFTLAAFLVVQDRRDVESLDGTPMNHRILRSLTRPRTLKYWADNGWLQPNDSSNQISLTTDGIDKVRARVRGEAKAQSVTPAQVEQWRQGILRGQGGDFHWTPIGGGR